MAFKVQDQFNKGFPDVICSFNGTTALVELKYREDYPARVDTCYPPGSGVTPEQERHLKKWQRGKGLALVLSGVARDWCLVTVDDALTVKTRDKWLEAALAHGEGYPSLIQAANIIEVLRYDYYAKM